jgi:hypothetical protein
MTSASGPGDSPAVETLRRWERFGGVWHVLARGDAGVTVSLCRCDDGEEVERLTSADPALEAFVRGAGRGR